MTRLLLIGGGHAHLFVLEALRKLAPSMREDIEVTLVSHGLRTPYSGMLPGLVAGHYDADDIHIDLAPLAAAAGVQLAQARIAALDPVTKLARADDGRTWGFDHASIDVGAVPPLWQVPGAAAHALAVKPVDAFLEGWSDIAAHAARAGSALRLAVVGGGAGGVELALAMSHRIRAAGGRIACTLVCRGSLLAGHPHRAARLAARQLAGEGIGLMAGAEVVEVEAGRLRLADGSAIAFDALVWATGAGAQSWLAQSGLACVNGFIEVDAHLQSTSHAGVFAAGDAASHAGRPWPKSGVTAVRQGPVLAENLLCSIRGQALVAYHAQRSHLALISTGRRHAIASWRGLAWQGGWVWRWKDRIDRRFMKRFFVSQSSDHLQRKY